MTLQEVRAQADRLLIRLAGRLFAVQRQVLDRHGRCWQAPWTHPAPPADGALVPADLLQRLGDETPSWADLGFDIDRALPCRVKVDVYETGPEGHGYMIVVEAAYAGRLYRRSYAVGPDCQARTHDWLEVPDGLI